MSEKTGENTSFPENNLSSMAILEESLYPLPKLPFLHLYEHHRYVAYNFGMDLYYE